MTEQEAMRLARKRWGKQACVWSEGKPGYDGYRRIGVMGTVPTRGTTSIGRSSQMVEACPMRAAARHDGCTQAGIA